MSRPEVPPSFGDGPWKELLILPFDSCMTLEIDNHAGWLQWGPEESIVISRWMYCFLGLIWPLLRLIYRKRLIGQNTDY